MSVRFSLIVSDTDYAHGAIGLTCLPCNETRIVGRLCPSDESTYWLRGIEAVFQGGVTPYIEPIGPAPVGGIQGRKARETLSELAHGELRKPTV